MKKCLRNCGLVLVAVFLGGCQSSPHHGGFFNNPLSQQAIPQKDLAQTVQEALARQDDPYIAQVRVQTRQAVVVLSGYVKKIRQSDTAEQIARQIPGVQLVENNIIVRP